MINCFFQASRFFVQTENCRDAGPSEILFPGFPETPNRHPKPIYIERDWPRVTCLYGNNPWIHFVIKPPFFSGCRCAHTEAISVAGLPFRFSLTEVSRTGRLLICGCSLFLYRAAVVSKMLYAPLTPSRWQPAKTVFINEPSVFRLATGQPAVAF